MSDHWQPDQPDVYFAFRTNNDPSSADPEEQETYKSYGRHLVRTCGPFERIHVIAEHGVCEALRDEDEEPPVLNLKYVPYHC